MELTPHEPGRGMCGLSRVDPSRACASPRRDRGRSRSLRHAPERETVKIIAYDNFKPGVTMDDITPYLPEEVSNVWRRWKAGTVRENYARADEPGLGIVFKLD